MQQVTMPQLGETVAEGTIGSWLKKEGETIRRDESLVEIITDKITTELPSPVGGTLARILVQPDQTVKVGTPIAEIEMAAVTTTAAATSTAPANGNGAATTTMAPPVANGSTNMDRISPLARKLAAEHQVDLAQIAGTGEGGRVRKEDILAFVERRNAGGAATATAPVAAAPAQAPVAVAPSAADGDTFITLTPVRRAIAEHMVRSKATSPHATTIMEVDMTPIAHFLEHNKATFKQQHGYSLTFVPFVTKAVCAALREVPSMNASWTADSRIQVHGHINMGFAVSTDNGLFVPVLRDADQKSIAELAAAVNDLATRARTNRLKPDEIQGSTFTVNNPGVFGTTFSVPVINQPNAGILSMDAVIKRPVVVEGDAIAIRSMMYICLSFDHRINDGLEGARFLGAVRRNLESYGSDINLH
ncbi:MAG: 2-oxo acid dehydrogenase subunit E2 [Ktedonobacterales bacterium]|nr:2-oxo acid dehydrogenase subunit E2 [Ktedonobacterales bacterium]